MGLQRRTPMPRGGPLRQVSARREAQHDGPLWSTLTRSELHRCAEPGRLTAPRWKTAKPTPDPVTTDVRAVVRRRSGGRCELCGTVLRPGHSSVQHRQRRGHGDHTVTNLLDVCGRDAGEGCHALCDRSPRRFDEGWSVRSWLDPASQPVLLVGGRRVLLTADGGYEAVAAVDP